MRKKQEILNEWESNNHHGSLVTERINLEIQIDIRDQLTRIANNLEPQVYSQDVKDIKIIGNEFGEEKT